jgi:hypothetical protein
MRNIKLLSGIIFLVVLVTASCKKPDYTYTGPSVVEFAPLTTSSTYTSAFTSTIKQANFVLSVDTLELTINLVGRQQTKDINVEYTLVTDTVKNFPSATYNILPTTQSTLNTGNANTESTYFDFLPLRAPGSNGVVTIPANSSFGKIKLNSYTAQVAPDVSKRVTIKLLPTADIAVNPNYQYFIVVITRL